MKNKNKTSISTEKMVALGAGAVALAATSYYLFGPEGKQHRKQAKGWMIKAKGEIIEKLEEAKEISEPIYQGIVDSVVANYTNKSTVATEELKEFGDRLKGQWKQITAGTKAKKRSATAKKGKK